MTMMDLKPQLTLSHKLTQRLTLTPQLQLTIKLLPLSRAQLVDTVNEELEENPVLEDRAERKAREIDWDRYLEHRALQAPVPGSRAYREGLGILGSARRKQYC